MAVDLKRYPPAAGWTPRRGERVLLVADPAEGWAEEEAVFLGGDEADKEVFYAHDIVVVQVAHDVEDLQDPDGMRELAFEYLRPLYS